MRIFISEKARRDLLGIYSYVAERNPQAAEAIAQRFETNFKNLSQFPFIGRERSNLAIGIRSLVVGVHLVFYVVERERIVIVRIIDGRMDVDEEFQR